MKKIAFDIFSDFFGYQFVFLSYGHHFGFWPCSDNYEWIFDMYWFRLLKRSK